VGDALASGGHQTDVVDLPARASQFDLGLQVVLDGLRSRVGQQALSPTR